MGAEPTIDPKQAMQKARKEYEEQQSKRVEALQKRLVALTTEDKEALDLTSVMLNCHRFMCWAKAELYGRCGAEDDLVEFADRWMRQAAEGPKGFTLKQAIADMKHQCLPLAEHFRKLNEAHQGKRLMRLKRIARHLDEHGLKLPTEQLRQKLGRCFRLGDVLVLHGEDEAVQAALGRFVHLQNTAKSGDIYFLSSGLAPASVADERLVTMPGSWWNGAANHIRKLTSTLEPFTNNEASLMLVDNLLGLITDHQDVPVQHRKQVALVRMYQWARENAAAVVIGNIDTEPADSRFYGSIPYTTVRFTEEKVLTFDGQVEGK